MKPRRTPPHDRVDDLAAPPGAARLVALGDPHGALERARAVVERERDPRTFICTVGDVVGYAPGARCSALVAWLASEGIPSVRGNHEDWMGPDGTMFLSDDGDVRLSPEALAEIDAWPWDLRVRFDSGDAVRVTHSLHEEQYDWISEDNVRGFADLMAPDVVTCTGHSHRPAIYRIGPSEVARMPFLFPDDESLQVPIEPGCRYVVDCGSLARPVLIGQPRAVDLGTYGVVDREAGLLELHRIG